MVALAKKLDELVVHQFDDLLPRGDAAQDIAVGGPLLHLRREVARDPEVDVRLQQGEAHFAQRLVDVLVGKASLVPDAGEDGGELVRQRVEHGTLQAIRDHGSEQGTHR